MNAADSVYIDINKKLIHLLDDLLATGDWQASLFLKTASKQFYNLREQAQQLLQEMTMIDAVKDQQIAEKPGHIKVYVSIYQSEGSNLEKWYKTLQSLTDYSMSRPVYREEEHARAMIRSKENTQREAYVIVFIKENDIITLPNGKVATDRWGKELLTLKTGAIKPENIIEFIHCDKKYIFQNETLVAKGVS